VFISGESGTGKELAARMIHDQGPRSGGPFMPVNCGAIPADLMESELFGHRRGAFTGAVSDKPGLFQAADGGTLFLDEVAEMPLATQVKLLRAIQEKRVRPVGAENEVGVDVRILSASHRDLGRLVRDGAFREDLYYRLDVITLTIPPLRERMEDVPELAGHILARLCGGGALPELDAGALAALAAHDFPGNVRELENLLERATAMCESGRIKADDLGLDPATRVREHARADPTVRAETAVGAAASVPERSPPAPALSLDGTLDQVLEVVERQTILNALEQVRWNKTRAAKRLGISFGALRYRMQKLGLD
jgi:two-component system response regulator PilR (NtrC family)